MSKNFLLVHKVTLFNLICSDSTEEAEVKLSQLSKVHQLSARVSISRFTLKPRR
jgi:hypothetical protein